MCVWDIALSEIRLAFVFLSLLISYVGYKALVEENKNKADIFLYGSIFLIMLLLVNGFFDIVQILDSTIDNETLCNSLKKMYPDAKSVECTFNQYYVTVGLTFVCTTLLLISARITSKWRTAVPKITDNL